MAMAGLVNRAGPGFVALETTLPVHGVPRERGRELCRELAAAVEAGGGGGARAAFAAVVAGRPVVGLTEGEIDGLFAAGGAKVTKVNTANLGVVMHRGGHGATTVSTTLELAAAAGVRVAATGGLGGVHRGYGERLDVSADLAALARFPVALVTSGVKSLLDVESTREVLETLGVPVVGFGTDRFPAFYLRESGAGVDARFDDVGDLGRYVAAELERTGRGVVVAHPIPAAAAVSRADWERWLRMAQDAAGDAAGRDATPRVLAELHRASGGATLAANIALAVSNAALAGRLCSALARAT